MTFDQNIMEESELNECQSRRQWEDEEESVVLINQVQFNLDLSNCNFQFLQMILAVLSSTYWRKKSCCKFGYSQTWVNDHLRIASTFTTAIIFESRAIWVVVTQTYLWTTTTCLQRPQIWGPSRGRGTQAWLYFISLFFFVH